MHSGPISFRRPAQTVNEAKHGLHKCHWLDCARTSGTKVLIMTHVSDHLKTLARDWPGLTKCRWSNCKSKAVFHSIKPLEYHVRDAHLVPLVCTVPGCSHPGPFGRKADLKRHEESKHGSKPEYRCNVKDCGAEFHRRDKLILHSKSMHEDLQCIYPHCGAVVSGREAVQHERYAHPADGFKCALGSCATGNKPCFTWTKLKRHLEDDHSMSRSDATRMADLAYNVGDLTARPEMCELLDISWEPCKWCAKHQQSVSPDFNNA